MKFTMPLFRRNNKTLKFDIVGVNDETLEEITALILQNGGKVVHDDTQPVKFTKPYQFVQNAFPGAKLYDIEFIKQCIEKNEIVDPVTYRIGKPLQYDDCVMAHFLGAICNCCLSKVLCTEPTERNNQNGSAANRELVSPPKRKSQSGDTENTSPVSLVNIVREHRSQSSIARKRGRGVAFTRAEELALLQYLTEHHVIREAATGLQVWEEIIKSGICQHRSANSLYSHFKKRILPNITRYGLTEQHLKKFNKIKNM